MFEITPFFSIVEFDSKKDLDGFFETVMQYYESMTMWAEQY